MAFITCSLIHTKSGLVPIQDLKVGDMVLSRKKNNPKGELVYKPIIRTFKSETKQPVMAPVESLDVICTESHPFWTKNHGWVTARNLDRNSHWIYQLGQDKKGKFERPSYIQCSRFPFDLDGFYLLTTPEKDINICFDVDFPTLLDEPNYVLVSFNEGIKQIHINHENEIWGWNLDNIRCTKNHIFLDKNKPEEKVLIDRYVKIVDDIIDYNVEPEVYLTDVYNIEVADYHTYFVGENGYWIADPTKSSKRPCFLSRILT